MYIYSPFHSVVFFDCIPPIRCALTVHILYVYYIYICFLSLYVYLFSIIIIMLFMVLSYFILFHLHICPINILHAIHPPMCFVIPYGIPYNIPITTGTRSLSLYAHTGRA